MVAAPCRIRGPSRERWGRQRKSSAPPKIVRDPAHPAHYCSTSTAVQESGASRNPYLQKCCQFSAKMNVSHHLSTFPLFTSVKFTFLLVKITPNVSYVSCVHRPRCICCLSMHLPFMCLHLESGDTQFHSAVHSSLYGLNDDKVHSDLTLTLISGNI